jgi:hypothetical protein
MRQGSNSRRGRGRGAPRKQGRNQTFDSNGPNGRLRGTAQQLTDKYLSLARDANSSGDRIIAENFYQHADHYFRIHIANNPQPDPHLEPAFDDDRGGQGNRGDGRQDDRRADNQDRRGDGREDYDDGDDERVEQRQESRQGRRGNRSGGNGRDESDAPANRPNDDQPRANGRDGDKPDAAPKAAAPAGNGERPPKADAGEDEAPRPRRRRRTPRADDTPGQDSEQDGA